MNNLIRDLDTVLVFNCVFIFVLCALRIALIRKFSHDRLQYVHVDAPITSTPYYFCYCKNGRKDKVIHMIEVSEKTFNNVTMYHDASEVIHIGRNKVYLDASKSGTSFSKLPDVR